jgi:NAD(P)-dependent dehydrogenase (short-subunit alcohol dehydrogenase family)
MLSNRLLWAFGIIGCFVKENIMTKRLEGQCAIVTGGAQGIGAACVKACIAEGAKVVLVDQHAPDPSWTEPFASALKIVQGSVTDPLTLEAARNHANAWGGPHLLVNNAGITHAASFLDLDLSDFDRVLAVNLRSYVVWGQAIARDMVAHKHAGCIINMSSVNAVVAIAEQVPYVISKGAVNQLTKVMALGLADHGIRVNAIGPGTIATELARAAVLGSEAARQKILSRTPLKRMGEPEEIAKVAVFLASNDASYFTGQVLYPDGGRLALNYSVSLT